MDNKEYINNIKTIIDELKEYVEGQLCKKCEEMSQRLEEYERILQDISRRNT